MYEQIFIKDWVAATKLMTWLSFSVVRGKKEGFLQYLDSLRETCMTLKNANL